MKKKASYVSAAAVLIAVLAAIYNFTGSDKTDTATTTAYFETTYVEEISTYSSVTYSGGSLSDTPENNFKIPSNKGVTKPYTVVNNNIPFFTEDDLTTEVFETYSDLDSLRRCGVAYANLCKELMPTEARETIYSVKPSGWKAVQYDFVDGRSLYNRCHLIGFQLAGENANEKNLITGTRSMNTQGMLPFENLVCDYVKETDNHVLYRVTPMFKGNDLVASGVLMEGYSVEDNGEGICFNVYCYNVEPGVEIDYSDGSNWLSGTFTTKKHASSGSYVINTNNMKFHRPDCESVQQMNPANKKNYNGSREDLINRGYKPCGACNP